MKVGDLLHDNDPRMTGRVLTIVGNGLMTERGLTSVRAKDRAGRTFSIAVKRIHIDGKKRRYGFTLEAA